MTEQPAALTRVRRHPGWRTGSRPRGWALRVAGERDPPRLSSRREGAQARVRRRTATGTRFQTEAGNLAALEHPGIVGAADYSADPVGVEWLQLVMEAGRRSGAAVLLAQAKEQRARALPGCLVRDPGHAAWLDELYPRSRYWAGIVDRDVKLGATAHHARLAG